jgi:class 3 adenylate cyclase
MIDTRKFSIRTRLQVMLLVASLGSILIVGLFSWMRARDILLERVLSQLTTERASKAYQIEEYFQNLDQWIETLCENHMVVEAMREFDAAFDALHDVPVEEHETAAVGAYYEKEFLPRLSKNTDGRPAYETYRPNTPEAVHLQNLYIAANPQPVGSKGELESIGGDSAYDLVHRRYQRIFQSMIKRMGFYDLFLVDSESGDVVYSVYKETDFGTNLLTGPYRNSNLAELFKKVRDDPDRGAVQIVDYQFYRPSYNAPAAFIGGSIYDGEKRIGILVAQMPVDDINSVLTGGKSWEKSGLGKTGETYLVGSDLLLRSASRGFLEDKPAFLESLRRARVRSGTVDLIEKINTPILLQPVDTVAAREALRGESSTRTIDGYRGEKVLSSYAPLAIPGVSWAIVSEMQADEAFGRIRSLEIQLLLACVLVVCASTAYAGFASKRFLSPIDRMLERARNPLASAGGPPETGSNELGELARSFDDMANRLREQTEENRRKDAEIESLLLAMLTRPAMERFRQGGGRVVDHIQQLTFIAMRIDGITGAIETHGAGPVAEALDSWASQLEDKAERSEIERVNCSGDRYFYACGLSRPQIPHVRRGVDFARAAMRSFTESVRKTGLPLRLRIGVESGSATAAVLGKRMFHQDVWGKAAENVWRLAEAAPPDGVLVGQDVHARVADVFSFTPTGSPGAWLLSESESA